MIATQTMNDISIRTTTARDATTAREIVLESGALEPNSAYAYAMLFTELADTCRVAVRCGEVLGFVLALVPPTRRDTVFVWQIGVRRSARGRGIGQSLLDAAASGPSGPFRYLEATVAPSNGPSRALFGAFAARRGASLFETTYLEPHHFPDGLHEPEPLLRIGPLRTHTS